MNTAVRQANGSKPGHIDHGLLENPAVTDKAQDGKFKVPTLRNVAVTGPYMHNGVFKDLRTTVLFYNRYNTKDPDRLINPETAKPFRVPEVPATLSVKELTHGPALDDKRIDALVAFLKTLTGATNPCWRSNPDGSATRRRRKSWTGCSWAGPSSRSDQAAFHTSTGGLPRYPQAGRSASGG